MRKPGRIIDENDLVEQSSKQVPPTRVEDEAIVLEELEAMEKERVTALKGIGSFAKKSMLVIGLLFSLIMIGTLYDATLSASSMLANAPVVGVVYLLLLFALLGIIGATIVKQYIGYKKIDRIDRLQERGAMLLTSPSEDVISYAKEITSQYLYHDNRDIAARAAAFMQEIDTLMYDEVLERLDEKLLQPLDKLARESIVKYANQTALSTAISPVALIDAVLILSRSHVMVHEIAKVYGYRPNLLGEIALFKKVFVTLAFASVTDILANHSHDILGTSLLSKLSLHGAQGVANGILIARVGIGTIKSCRPLHYKESNGGFLKSLTKVIVEAIFKRTSKS
jgi:putative membrane protein